MIHKLLFLVICCQLPLYAKIILSDQGKTDHSIVLSSSATDMEKFAAAELSAYLGKITGATYDIADTPGKYSIFIGSDAASKGSLSLSDLGIEGYLIAEQGQNLYLSGKTPDSRGTLYGVFCFLEKLGCRFWSEKEEDIPCEPSLVYHGGNISENPAFPLLRLVLSASSNWKWHMNGKMRQNGLSFRVKREPYAGRITEIAPWNSHTFAYFISAEKYGTTHPEYFALRNGVRMADGSTSQLCLTNTEMQDTFIENVREYLRQNYHPGLIINIAANDNGNSCQCENCLAVDEEEGSPSGLLLRLTNKIADAFKDKYPDLIFSMDAYWHTIEPPKKTRPLPNVYINVANSGIDFARAHDEGIQNIEFLNRLKTWAQLANGISVIDYGANYCQYFFPLPNFEATARKYREYHKNNVKGIYVINDVGNPRPFGEFSELRTWFTGRLMWNPWLDPWKLVEEFCNGFYGAAGSFLYEYLHWYHDYFLKHHQATFFMNKPPVEHILSEDYVEAGIEYFRKAFDAVKNNQKFSNRVRRAYTAVQYQELSLNLSKIANSPELIRKLKSFEAACLEFGILGRGENLKLCDFLELCLLNPELPPYISKISPEDRMVLPVDYWPKPEWMKIVEDPKSSRPSKSVVKMFSATTAWTVYKRTNNLYAIDNDDLWDAWACARVIPGKLPNPDTIAFHGGFWESKVNQQVTSIKLSETSQTEYRYFKIASNFPVGLTSQVYVAPVNNPGEVDSIFVDFIVFVKSAKKTEL